MPWTARCRNSPVIEYRQLAEPGCRVALCVAGLQERKG